MLESPFSRVSSLTVNGVGSWLCIAFPPEQGGGEGGGGEGGGEGGDGCEQEQQPKKEEEEEKEEGEGEPKDDGGKVPDYNMQKEEIYPLLSQRLKKGDYW